VAGSGINEPVAKLAVAEPDEPEPAVAEPAVAEPASTWISKPPDVETVHDQSASPETSATTPASTPAPTSSTFDKNLQILFSNPYVIGFATFMCFILIILIIK
jgi:hypothetical protein